MNVHKNARSCPASRALLIKRVFEHAWSVRAASEAAGMSDRRCREWIRRADREEPLTDRSSRPLVTSAIDSEKRAQIIELRRERRTMRQVARVAGVSLSTVARTCKSEGLSRLRSLEPPPPPVRYERETPGELLHIDTKRLGRFDRPGHRITRKRSFGAKKQGFEFVFVATDDHTRLSFARIVPDEDGDSACRFLLAAVLETTLRTAVMNIEQDVSEALDLLDSYKAEVLSLIATPNELEVVLRKIQGELGVRAGQGVYATLANGNVAGFALPDGLSRTARSAKTFVKRPYFRQARMFRHGFVSDVSASVFNGQTTVFFCIPLGNEASFEGLLFAAAQPGAWTTPVTQRAICAPADFILVDSNGVVLVPPLRELGVVAATRAPMGEPSGLNEGFDYERVHELSRRDTHVAHIVQNVVPMGFDDDIHDVGPDFRLYSMVANIDRTRWKIGR